jgi:hypothetical protein
LLLKLCHCCCSSELLFRHLSFIKICYMASLPFVLTICFYRV